MALVDKDRLFPLDSDTRIVARELYNEVSKLPIVSPSSAVKIRNRVLFCWSRRQQVSVVAAVMRSNRRLRRLLKA